MQHIDVAIPTNENENKKGNSNRNCRENIDIKISLTAKRALFHWMDQNQIHDTARINTSCIF